MATVFVGLAENGADELLMAADAILLQDFLVAGGDLDRFVEVLESESPGVAKAVIRLADPLSESAFRDVAVVASRVVVMAGGLPAVVHVAHDMTVHTRLRIVTQVCKAIREMEGVGTDATQHADQDAENKPLASSGSGANSRGQSPGAESN